MMKKISATWASSLFALALTSAFVACQKEDKVFEPKDSTHTEGAEATEEMGIKPINPGEALTLEVSGELEGFEGEDTARALQLDNKPDKAGDTPMLYTKSVEENWGIFYFKKLGSPNVTKRALKYTIIPVNGDGQEVPKSTRARIQITVRPARGANEPQRDQTELTLNNGETFAEGDWYISGILGTGESLKNGNVGDQMFNSFSKNAPQGLSNAIEWDPMDTQRTYRDIHVPIKLKWSKLKTGKNSEGGRQVGTAESKDLKFSVVGSILSMNARSDMFDDVRITGVYLKSYGLSFNGVFAENQGVMTDDALQRGEDAPFRYQQKDQGEWDRATAKNWNVLYANFFKGEARGSVLKAGHQSASYLKLLVMPIVPPTEEYKLRHRTHASWLVTKADQTVGASRSILQTLNMKTKANPAAGESKNGVVEGRFYNANVNLETDLMISEIFNHNPSGYNYGWTELYNGTLHDIDLSNYALGRSEYHPFNGTKYYLPMPHDVTQHGSYVGAGFGSAMVLPLTMESVAYRRNNSLGRGRLVFNEAKYQSSALKSKWEDPQSKTLTAMGVSPGSHVGEYWGHERIYVAGIGSYYKDTYHNENFIYNDKTEAQRRILPPGKTIIILNYGYFVDQFENKTVTPVSSNNWPGKKGYLHGPQMARAYMAGYCHDIVVMASFGTRHLGYLETKTGENYRINAGNYDAPVNHKADADGMFLVRRLPNGQKRIIDAYGPLVTRNGVDAFYKGTSADRFVAVRKDNILFPDYQATREQWNWSTYKADKQATYPNDPNVWTSAGTRYKHGKIRPNYQDTYDGTDTYDGSIAKRGGVRRQW